MTNKVSSIPPRSDSGPLHRYGGIIDAGAELPVSFAADDYELVGNALVRELPMMDAGSTVSFLIKGTPTFIHSKKLICPGAVNYVATAGDRIIARHERDKIWRIYVQSAVLSDSVKAIRRTLFSYTGGSLTYTPDPNLLYASIECQAPGGGGAGAVHTSATGIAVGGGGGSGGKSIKIATAADIGASKSVSIAAPGNGGAAGANNGTDGGDVSVGSLCIAKGGHGGTYSQVGVTAGAAGAGGVSGTGDLTQAGSPGQPGGIASITSVSLVGGAGGGTGGGAAKTSDSNGEAAAGYGGGGSAGASVVTSNSRSGGAGANGYVLIIEYCRA
ncbi:hypothetical protein [Tardiphaga sp. 841_E9_N1_2]|uniref:glycine-rich domain-containing protein n=1 Tax=Tardiphaga sp. 841_E9_N1_2 TaxID=3240762 RepID=UPI003F242240